MQLDDLHIAKQNKTMIFAQLWHIPPWALPSFPACFTRGLSRNGEESIVKRATTLHERACTCTHACGGGVRPRGGGEAHLLYLHVSHLAASSFDAFPQWIKILRCDVHNVCLSVMLPGYLCQSHKHPNLKVKGVPKCQF